MRKIIVNSTPLIGLSKIDRLDILQKMYGSITIPQAVFEEVTQKNDAVRKTAEFLGLNVTGTIGVLIKAKNTGYIKEVMPIIFELEKQGIYFSDTLKSRVKRMAGEI